MLFAFDVKRRAILLVGGDKSTDWSGWYRTNIPIADDRFAEHQASIETQRPRPRAAGHQNERTQRGKKR